MELKLITAKQVNRINDINEINEIMVMKEIGASKEIDKTNQRKRQKPSTPNLEKRVEK